MPDLGEILLPDVPVLEILLRGTLTYLVIFALLRITFNRSGSSIGMTDLLVVVLIADAAQNAMAADYTSWTDGMLLVAVIIGWAYAMDWLAHRFPGTVGRWVHPGKRDLVRDGRIVWRNLDRELVSREELMTQLRLAGIDDIRDVKLAAMEGNGEVSVIRREPGGDGGGKGAAKDPRAAG